MKIKTNIIFHYTVIMLIIFIVFSTILSLIIANQIKYYLINTHIKTFPDYIQNDLKHHKDVYNFLLNKGKIQISNQVSDFFDDILSLKNVFRYQIWDTDGNILWSSRPEFIGRNFNNNKNFQLAINDIVNYNLVENKSTIANEESFLYILKIYIPIKINNKVTGVVELFESDKELFEKIKSNITVILIITFISIFILYLFLFNLFYNTFKKIKRINKQLQETQDVTIFALGYQAELRDLETGQHLERTSKYVEILANELKKNPKYSDVLTESYITDLIKSAPLHDIGKAGIPDSILRKPGKLTNEEFEVVKLHCVYGSMILQRAEEKLSFKSFLEIAIDLVSYHHEWWNGTGYPENLKGEDIPLSARIMAIADVYDALRTKRHYKDILNHEKCVKIIKNEKGTHFDPEIIDAFLNKQEDFENISNELCD